VASFTKASALTPAQLAQHEAEAERHRLQQQQAAALQQEQPASAARALPVAQPAGLLDDATSADTSSTFKRRRVYGLTPQLSASTPSISGSSMLGMSGEQFVPPLSSVIDGLQRASAPASAGQQMEDGEHKTPAPVQATATVTHDGASTTGKRKEHATSEPEARALKSPPPVSHSVRFQRISSAPQSASRLEVERYRCAHIQVLSLILRAQTAAELAAATVSAEEELMADVELSKVR
jgi:hypothetical protein